MGSILKYILTFNRRDTAKVVNDIAEEVLVELVALLLGRRSSGVRDLELDLDEVREPWLLRRRFGNLFAFNLRIPLTMAGLKVGLEIGVRASVGEGFTTKENLVVLVSSDGHLAQINLVIAVILLGCL